MLAGVKIPLSTAEHGAASTGIARGLSEPSGEFRSARAGRAARRVSAAIADDSDAGRSFLLPTYFFAQKISRSPSKGETQARRKQRGWGRYICIAPRLADERAQCQLWLDEVSHGRI